MKPKITVHIGNYNGMRNRIKGKGRLEITIESLLKCYPRIQVMDVRILDNFSEDGSWDFIRRLPFGRKTRRPRIETSQPWLTTTINNMGNLIDTILDTDSDYIWNVENDSYFFNTREFVEKAMEVLESNPDISIIHLKSWTNICAIDSPGVPTNLSRFSEVRKAPSGFPFYVMEKRTEYSLWIPVETNFREDFVPDNEAGYGKCPTGIERIGAVRMNEEGKYERLLTEHWNSYTSHGWIGRTRDILFLIRVYRPLGERQMSRAFKNHFRAAKLDEDAFIDFGWKFRANPSEEEILKTFRDADCHRNYSISRFGTYKAGYKAGNLYVSEDKINVYQ